MAFSLDAARGLGLTRAQLLGSRWRRIGPGVYAAREVAGEPLIRLQAAMLRLPDEAMFSGPPAAFLHSLDRQLVAIDATLPPESRVSRRVGITIRRRRLDPDDVVIRMGFRVTSALRTVVDLTSKLSLVEAVVLVDTALMETRLRLLLVLACLPRPLVNVPLRQALARADLYYPDRRLVIEYDGATHRDSIGADDRRQNRLIEAGYRVLRFAASDVLSDPESALAIVRRAVG